MLRCFSFSGYHTLKEDDYTQVFIAGEDIASDGELGLTITPRAISNTLPVRTFRKTQSGFSGTKSSSLQVIPSATPGAKTKHIDRAEVLRKAATSADPGLVERYIRFPVKTVSPATGNKVSSPADHSLTDNRRKMPKARIHWNSGAGPSSSNSGGCHHNDGLPSEWSKNGSLINKPPRGWLHADQQILDGGVNYGVRYIGCVEVNTSMKSLDFDTRSQIAKECINRICEAAGLKTADKKRKIDKRLTRMLAERPNMDHAGSNVNLVITSAYLSLTVMESREMIANHEMPNISFASGGDPDTLDFVAYVAKDLRYGRACFVLECGGGLAQDVITTIGQAFELRFKEFLRRAPRAISVPDRLENPVFNGNTSAWGEDPEYYNDLPGKVPPEAPPPLPPLPDYHQNGDGETNISSATSSNLIDLNIETNTNGTHKKQEPDYVNTSMCISVEDKLSTKELSRDAFDMQPFENNLPSPQSPQPPPPPRHRTTPTSPPNPPPHATGSPSSTTTTVKVGSQPPNRPIPPVNHRAVLLQEEWFHGPISRKDSEALVIKDGDFLVRESQGSPGQYVLTGMQAGIRKHLLLVDPEGVVRTKDRTFESVSHLVNYHRDNGLPIISAESALVLRNPIPRTRPTR